MSDVDSSDRSGLASLPFTLSASCQRVIVVGREIENKMNAEERPINQYFRGRRRLSALR